jgi:4-amino-4-deoxy-L-arabinose transferase-like glycosyltransferase
LRALGTVIAFFAVTTMVWLRLDTVPPSWDEAHYLRASHELYRTLLDQGPVAFAAAFSQALGTKAPLIAVLPFPFYVLFGESHLAACYVNVALVVVASWYLFKLGELVAGRRTALMSVIVLNTFPLVAALSRVFLVEYGLMTLVIAWMYYLVRWRSGEIGRSSWALGLLLGLGLLMKVSFPLYVAAPTVTVMAPWLVGDRRAQPAPLGSLLRVVAIGGAVAAPWYLENWATVLRFVVEGGYGELAEAYGRGAVFSLATVTAYWRDLVSFGVSTWYGLLLALTGCSIAVVSLGRRRWPEWPSGHLDLLLAWWVFPWLVLTFAVNKDVRYTMAYLPALALLLCGAIARLFHGRLAIVSLALVAALGGLNYGLYSFALPRPQPEVRVGGLIVVGSDLGWAHPPVAERWPNEAVLELLTADAAALGSERPRATLLFSHRRMSVHNMNYLAVLHGSPLRFDTCQFQSPETPSEHADRVRSSAAYLLMKSGDLGGVVLNVKNVEVASLLQREGMPFEKMGAFVLPDRSELTILRRTVG